MIKTASACLVPKSQKAVNPPNKKSKSGIKKPTTNTKSTVKSPVLRDVSFTGKLSEPLASVTVRTNPKKTLIKLGQELRNIY